MLDKTVKAVKVSRPVLWPFFSLFFLYGVVVSGTAIGPVHWLVFFALTFPYSFVLYGLNDLYDRESDAINDRKDGIMGEPMDQESSELVKKWAPASGLFLLLAAILSGNLVTVVGAVFLLLGALMYSVPPFRIKEKPPLDNLANGIFYVLVPFAMGFTFVKPLTSIPSEVFWLGVVFLGLHTAGALADYEADKRAGHRTVAHLLGRKGSMACSLGLILVTLVFSSIDSLLGNLFLLQLAPMALLMAGKPGNRYVRYIGAVVYIEGLVLAGLYLIQLRVGLPWL